MWRRGATLLEVIVAMSLAGLALGVLAQASGIVIASSERLLGRIRSTHDSGTAILLLGEALQRVPRLDTLPPPFGGTAGELWTRSRCRRSDGSTESCTIEARLRGVKGEQLLEIRFGSRPFTSAGFWPLRSEFRYFDSERNVWLQEWTGAARAPRAIGIVTDGDTMVLGTGL